MSCEEYDMATNGESHESCVTRESEAGRTGAPQFSRVFGSPGGAHYWCGNGCANCFTAAAKPKMIYPNLPQSQRNLEDSDIDIFFLYHPDGKRSL